MARGRNSYSSNGKQPADRPKVKITRESLREALSLFRYIKPYRGKFILSMVFIALSAFTTAMFPLFLGKMIDAASPVTTLPGLGSPSLGAHTGFNLKDIHWSLNTTLLLIFLQLTIQTIFSYMRIYLLTEVGEKSLAGMRKDV
ncbi:MAG TPA: ABC transporter transmembrane domain-containing protein, partial [Chitinophagaceae bacterium]|nr:ABC transporter transmembrane domain-containing protein [Chitinophagaceae bacterium]